MIRRIHNIVGSEVGQARPIAYMRWAPVRRRRRSRLKIVVLAEAVFASLGRGAAQRAEPPEAE